MSCTLLTGGVTIACSPNIGGIKKAYITDFVNVEDGFTESNGVVSAVSIDSGENYYEFEFNKNTSFYTESEANSIENGTNFKTQVVTLVIPRREVAKRNVIRLLAQKRLSIIVKDQNGLNWVLGMTNGMDLTTNEGGSGTSKADLNGYTLTFTGEEPEMASTVSDAILATLI